MTFRRRLLILTTALLIVAIVTGVAWKLYGNRTYSLPYSDSFATQRVSEWIPYGGSWRLDGDTVMVRSIERGAKLVTGSDRWKDYQVTADIQLRGHGGDIGIAVRVNEPKIGIDAYRGYFAGLRFDDSSLTIGRSDGHWLSVMPVYVPGGVHYKQWYRLHVVSVGCQIAVGVTDLNTGTRTFTGLSDTDSKCIHAGKIALRATDTNGAWKNIRVERATVADLPPDAQVQFSRPQYPIREREYNAMREQYLSKVPPAEISPLVIEGSEGSLVLHDDSPFVKIDELRGYLWNQSPVRIVGVVTSSDPIYIQDMTAGIRLSDDQSTSLQVGDEVELLGRPVITSDLIRFAPQRSRILWDQAPVVALSVTATQAATGRYDGSLVDLSGTIRKITHHANGDSDLLLQEETQFYSARIPVGLFNTPSAKFEISSRVRVRGICSTTEQRSWPGQSSFVLLAGSPSDVVVLAGPPWWSGQRLIWLLCGLLALIALGMYGFVAIERSKLRMVYEERQRLSHDMHDTLAQSLAGVGFKLQGIRRSMRDSEGIPPAILEALNTACEMVAGTHREASASIAALHPASPNESDLLTLLQRSVFSMVDGDAMTVETEQIGDIRSPSPVVADTLFRIGREAIANTLRHAKATSIKISITYRSRDLILSVMDNGSGFRYTPTKRGFGIKSIERRCADIDAKVDVASSPGAGCTVRVISPYRMNRGLSRWIRELASRRL